MQRARRTRWLLVTALATTSVMLAGPPPSAAAAQPTPIHLIDLDVGIQTGGVSDDGRYIHRRGALTDHYVIDTHTNAVEALGQPAANTPFVDRSGTVYSYRDEQLWREPFGGAATTVPLALPTDWFPTGVEAISPTGDRAAISAGNGVLAQSGIFVIDLSDGGVLADNDGLTTGPYNTGPTWFLDDGSIVVAQFALVGQSGFDSYAVWTPDLSSVATIEPPAEHDPTDGPFLMDRAADHIWFATDQGGVVAGIGAGPARIYRRHLDSGVTAAAPVDAADASHIEPLPGGGLLAVVDLPPGKAWNRQLFRWDGAGATLEQLTIAFDGGEPNGAVVSWWTPSVGDVITVSSRASNLSTAVPSGPRGEYLYQVTQDTRPAPTTPPAFPPIPVPVTEPQTPGESAAPIAPNETYCVPVVGARPGEFVGANITPVGAGRNGNGALHSGDDEPPATANVNFAAGSVDPNVAFAEVGTDRTACFTNSRHGSVDVVIDALVIVSGEAFRLPSADGAVRIADTRSGLGGSRLAADETRCVPATGGSPGDYAGVNITPVNAVTRGNGALHSSDDDPPATANVNFAAGSVDPNLAFARVGDDGQVCFTNSVHGPVELVMDLLVIAAPDAFTTPTPGGAVRLVDTREALGGTRFAASETQCFAATGADPNDWIGVNLTPVGALTSGNGALHSSDDDPPATANVNFRAGSVDPNLAFARVGDDGQVCFTNSRHGPLDLVADALFVADGAVFRAPTTAGAYRLTDTRLARHDGVVAEPPPLAPPLVRVEGDTDLRLVDASGDGRYVLFSNIPERPRAVVDTHTAATSPIAFVANREPTVVANDGTAYAVEIDTIWAYPFGGAPVSFPVTLPGDWEPSSVVDVDSTGSRALVRASRNAGFEFRFFVVDLDTGSSVNGADGLSDTDEQAPAWFRDDGTVVTFRTDRYLVWNAGLTASTEITRPIGSTSWRPWAIDATATWVWFFNEEEDVQRLFRRSIATGETVIAPTRAGGANTVHPLPDGSIIVSTDDPFSDDDPVGVNHWNGSAASLRRLDTRDGETAPNARPIRIFPPSIGSVVTFDTFATDLGSQLIRGGRFGQTYQVDVGA